MAKNTAQLNECGKRNIYGKISTSAKELRLLEQWGFGTGIRNARNQHSTGCV